MTVLHIGLIATKLKQTNEQQATINKHAKTIPNLCAGGAENKDSPLLLIVPLGCHYTCSAEDLPQDCVKLRRMIEFILWRGRER